MPYDPLYLETPGIPALLEELGVPIGVAVHIYRPGQEWWAAKDRRFAHYHVMFLISIGLDTEEKEPRTWAPGVEPYHVWLARIRYGTDIAYGEMRPSVAEGLHGQVRWPDMLDGRVPVIGNGEIIRASYGVRMLRGLIPKLGRITDAVLHPNLARDREALVREAMRVLGTRNRKDITQANIAEYLHLDDTTLRKWFPLNGRFYEDLKQEILDALSHR